MTAALPGFAPANSRVLLVAVSVGDVEVVFTFEHPVAQRRRRRPGRPRGHRTADEGATWEPVAHQPHMLFVDTLAVAADRHVYFTVNQLHLRVAIDAGPVRR